MIWETVIPEGGAAPRVEIDAPPIGFGPDDEEEVADEPPPLLPQMAV